MPRPHFDRRQREPQTRINHRIRADPVRVIGSDGSMLGVLSNREAIRVAQEQGLDLVEVNPKAEPPVCKIMDFGKFKYEEKKRASEAKRKQTTVELKEVKLRPKTDDHDLNFKLRAARRFVETGNKVKFVVRFRGREIAHPEKAQSQLVWLLEHLEDIANADSRPSMEGRTMTVLVSPKPQVLQAISAAKAAEAERKRKAAKAARAAEIARGEAPPGSEDDIDETEDDIDDEEEEFDEDGDALHEPDDDDDEDDDAEEGEAAEAAEAAEPAKEGEEGEKA
ncbi:MAG: translation initiation factor IF-3 [Deltaproteobacteria bacterium HGW-Deltaproteobacteria-20]|jgi:translation initiation factor IF-3|nr:MAG: translation initiation factor IF-3 [Deltaproteobacteria bacterium HGW-Deltaproteobacteria-20]